MTTDPVEVLARALDQLAELIDDVDPGQASKPTPCRSWDLGRLLDHVLADLPPFIEAARGERPDYSAAVPSVAPEWSRTFRRRSIQLLREWSDARDPARLASGQEPREFQPMQVAELTVHAWDVASALNRTAELDPELADFSVAFLSSALKPQYRGSEEEGKSFGPIIPVPDDAPAYDRLASIAGRDPGWSPSR
jgi:TIGR03086 family protein